MSIEVAQMDAVGRLGVAIKRIERLESALDKITKTPIMPFPDPSWRAYAIAVHRAWCDQVHTARAALNSNE